MPNLGPPLARKSDDAAGRPSEHRCRGCRELLRLERRHVSPARLGAPMTTEFYSCPACDAGYAFNPTALKWKTWAGNED